MKVICINDSNRPSEIPISKWIKKDEIYTIVSIVVHNLQNKLIGFVLAEVSLEGCEPYTTFSSERFSLTETIIQEELQLETLYN